MAGASLFLGINSEGLNPAEDKQVDTPTRTLAILLPRYFYFTATSGIFFPEDDV